MIIAGAATRPWFSYNQDAGSGIFCKHRAYRQSGCGSKPIRILTIIDEASRECLALVVARRLNHDDVLAAFAEPFIERGPPVHVRSDNGSEFIATASGNGLGRSA